jgi:acyl-CoA thioester hydrolase
MALVMPMQTFSGVVYPWHCDHVGHMNVMYYMAKFDEATWYFFNRIGLTRALLAAHHRGMAAVEQRIAYQKELRAGDVPAHRDVGNRGARQGAALRAPHAVPDTATRRRSCSRPRSTSTSNDRKSVPLPDAVREHARGLVTAMEMPWDKPR